MQKSKIILTDKKPTKDCEYWAKCKKCEFEFGGNYRQSAIQQLAEHMGISHND